MLANSRLWCRSNSCAFSCSLLRTVSLSISIWEIPTLSVFRSGELFSDLLALPGLSESPLPTDEVEEVRLRGFAFREEIESLLPLCPTLAKP